MEGQCDVGWQMLGPVMWERAPSQRAALAALVSSMLAGGCAASQTVLPDVASLPSRAAATADRARHERTMVETESVAASRQPEAIERIEGAR